jgi:hypothetical protein
MHQMFQAIGGFQLITGFFQRIDVDFRPNICSALFTLFASLSSRALRSHMLGFIWLNFDLWSKMSFAFQLRIYRGELMQVRHKGEFELLSFDFLLYQFQLPFTESPYEVQLTMTEQSQIKAAQWLFLLMILCDRSDPVIFMCLLSVDAGHKSILFGFV